MRLARGLLARCTGLFRRDRGPDIAAEFESHLALQIEANQRAGMDPAEARRSALLKLGNPETAKEICRDRRTVPWLEHALRDWRYGLRQLRRNPLFSLTAVATLALGVCASVSIFAFVDAALLKPLPYPHPEQLLGVFESVPDFRDTSNLSYFDYLDWKRLNSSFSSLDVYQRNMLILTTPQGTEAIHEARVSAGFFRTLGVHPLLGRDFRPGEDALHAAPTVLLSYAGWQKRYGGNPDVIGRTISDSGTLKTIIGVLPQDFYFAPVGAAEFWVALQPTTECESRRSCHDLYGVGRLRPGVSIQAALSNMQAIARRLEQQYPNDNHDQGANVLPLSDYIVGPIRHILLMLMAGAALLLLIAGVNVASLLLVRAETRKREMAVRSALGAGRIRLITQFAAETFSLVLAGSALGLFAARSLIALLTKLISSETLMYMPFLGDLGLNTHVLLFAGTLAALAFLLFTAIPAMRLPFALRADLAESSRSSSGLGWRRAGSRLVILELATATVLLAGAGLLAKSLYLLMQVDIGLAPDRLVTIRLAAPEAHYAKNPQLLALERELLSRIDALPGVRAAAVTSDLPVEGWGDTTWFRIIGRPWHGEHNDTPERDVSAGYFQTIGAALLRGRNFSETDDGSKPLVAIVNQAFAGHYFPGEDPLGKQIIGLGNNAKPIQIVGLVADIKEGPLDTANRPVLYFPFNQNLSSSFNLVVRTTVAEHAFLHTLLSAIHQFDPAIATAEEMTMRDKMTQSESAWIHRSSAWLVAGFAFFALLLGIVGLYGVVAYSVAQRKREIGIRMALGAEQRGVYRLVLGEAARLALAGLLAGLLCSILASHWMRSILFGVRPWDLTTLLAVSATLGLAALAASFLPARRAASVDPVEALRNE
jgi:macrolide transport system ATP-binding/permease protein